MSDNKSNGSAAGGGGIGLLGAMFLIFMTLKLCGVIDWSWWWVTAPLWAVPALLIAACVVVVAAIVILMVLDRLRRPKRPKPNDLRDIFKRYRERAGRG
jgi:nitrate/nitrite transporter NarK